MRWLVSLAVCLAALFASADALRAGRLPPQTTSASRAPVSAERATLDRYCVSCHNGTVKAGGLELDSLQPERATEHPEAWERVVRKLRGRMMPPAGRPRPDEASYDAIVSSLESSLDRAA